MFTLLLLTVVAIFMPKFVVQLLLRNGYITRGALTSVKNILTLLFLMTFVDSRLFAIDSRFLLSTLDFDSRPMCEPEVQLQEYY